MAVVALSGVAVVSCGGPGLVGGAVRPDEKKAADALGKKGDCRAPGEEPQLLTLDWEDTQRSELELAMRKHVAVVKYDCGGFKVLRDCKAQGTYEYAGFSPAKTTAKITDEDQLAANLPLGAVSMSADVQRGSTIDLVYLAVGQQATTVRAVARTKLNGSCDGATHTVRTANVGAFALATGTKGSANAAVEILGKGASGSSSSAKRVERVNGELAACNSASDSATEPTPKCKALVQLLLSPIREGGAAAPAAAKFDPKEATAAPVKSRCPAGLKLDKDGLCSNPSQATGYMCDVTNFDECRAQCDNGDARSCFNAGANRADTKYNKTRYEKSSQRYDDAFQFMNKACSLGLPQGCRQVGLYYQWGHGVKRDHDKAESILLKACAAGDPVACKYTASEYKYGTNGFKRDATMFFQQSKRACALGDQEGCIEAANALIEGIGVTKDMDAAVTLLAKVCDAGDDVTCKRALNMKRDVQGKTASGEKARLDETRTAFGPSPLENPCGQGLRVDPNGTCSKPEGDFLCDPSDFEECKVRCEKGDGRSCLNAAANRVGKWNKASKTGPEDAFPFLQKSCAADYAPGCGDLANALQWGKGVKSDRPKAQELFLKACNLGDVISCNVIASNSDHGGNGFAKDPAKSVELYEKACDLGHSSACVDGANILESGKLVPKNVARAAAMLEKACKLGHDSVCSRAAKLRNGSK